MRSIIFFSSISCKQPRGSCQQIWTAGCFDFWLSLCLETWGCLKHIDSHSALNIITPGFVFMMTFHQMRVFLPNKDTLVMIVLEVSPSSVQHRSISNNWNICRLEPGADFAACWNFYLTRHICGQFLLKCAMYL